VIPEGIPKINQNNNSMSFKFKRYVGIIDDVVGGSLDFIVVDGHFRKACLQRVARKLRPDGLLIIDNTDVLPRILLDTLRTDDSRAWNNGISETTVIRNIQTGPGLRSHA
jgi:hypothetical protein